MRAAAASTSVAAVTSAVEGMPRQARAATLPAALTMPAGPAASVERAMPVGSMVGPTGASAGVMSAAVPASTDMDTPPGLTGGAATGAAVSGRVRTTG